MTKWSSIKQRAVSSINLDYVLRNLAIETIIVCSVYTDECVSNAMELAATWATNDFGQRRLLQP